MVSSHCRGWKIIRAGQQWIYADTLKPCWGKDDRRPCKRCGEEPTPEGHDACLGTIPGVATACCGHGVYEGWLTTKENLGIKETGDA